MEIGLHYNRVNTGFADLVSLISPHSILIITIMQSQGIYSPHFINEEQKVRNNFYGTAIITPH